MQSKHLNLVKRRRSDVRDEVEKKQSQRYTSGVEVQLADKRMTKPRAVTRDQGPGERA